MPKIGPYDKGDLAEKLVTISDEEMRAFNKKRMDKYRLYYIIAIMCGILSIIFIFFKGWISITFAVIGFIIANITSFKRNKWKRVYENLIYLKKERQKTINEMDKGKNRDKYKRSGIN